MRRKELTAAEGEGWLKAGVREFGMDMYTLLYLKWITNKDLLYTWTSAQCCVPAWTEWGLGENGDRYMYS